MWQLELLGVPRLRRHGAEVPLSMKKGQALMLLLAVGGELPRTRIAALLWPRLDEADARRNLRRELARLREAGAGDAVAAHGDVLGLAADVASDVRDFEADLKDQRPDDALRRWRGALADGLVLPDSPDFDDWLALQRERCWRLRAQALEASAAACEQRGDLAAALERVQSLLQQDPLQEQRHLDAMRLHAALGQRAAALAQYERCRALLRDELGLAPMARTEALADQLRRAPAAPGAAPASAGPPAAAAQGRDPLLPMQLPFVGRDDEVRALEAAWRDGCALLVEGDAGTGKSRLAIDFVSSHGPHALVRCRPSDRSVPYAAFTRALRALAGPTPAVATLPAGVADELARLLPELGPAPPPLRNDAERARFAEACTAAWSALSAENFDAVVLDDWHHADTASRELMVRIAERRHERRAAEGIGAREVLVYRLEGDLAALADGKRSAPADTAGAAAVPSPGDGRAAATVGLLTGTAAAHRLRLGSLGTPAVMELVQRLAGAAAPRRFVQRLVDITAGHPFFVAETLRHWAECGLLARGDDGRWRTPFDDGTQDYAELPVPGSLHATVLERVDRQSAAGRRVLEAAAMAVEPFAPALLAPACALSELDTVIAIEDAVRAQLLREHESGGYAFVHDLVQQAIDSALGPERRRLVHRRLALAAETAGAPAATVALHHEASGELPRAVPHRLRAGDDAQRLHALREAIDHWQRGLDDRPTPSQALALRLRMLPALHALARVDAQREQGQCLLQLARDPALTRAERVQAVTSAAVNLSQAAAAAQALAALDTLPPELPPAELRQVDAARAGALAQLGRTGEAIEVLQRAFDRPGLAPRHRAELLYQLASTEHTAGRTRAAADHIEQALAIFRGLDDAEVREIARMTLMHGVVLYQLARLEEAAQRAQEAAALAASVGDLRLERLGLLNLASTRISQLQPEPSLQAVRRAMELLAREPNLALRGMLLCGAAVAELMLGQLGPAWRDACLAVEVTLKDGSPYRLMSAALELAELFELVGDGAPLQPLLDTLDRLEAADPQLFAGMAQASLEMWVARAQAAMLAGDRGRAAAALARLGPAAADASIEDQRVRQRAQVARAEFALGSGRVDDAAAGLPAPADTLAADGLRLRAWAVRIGVGAARGSLTDADRLAAQAELQAHPPAVVPTAAALPLHRALAGASAAFAADVAAAVQRDAAACVERLAASLAGEPALQAAFLARWGDLRSR